MIHTVHYRCSSERALELFNPKVEIEQLRWALSILSCRARYAVRTRREDCACLIVLSHHALQHRPYAKGVNGSLAHAVACQKRVDLMQNLLSWTHGAHSVLGIFVGPLE